MHEDETVAAQRRMVEAFRNPACYPHPVAGVSLIETHISFVLLTGAYAYKIKKAVDLGFVDYTGLERRRFFCGEELRLNRRLAPRLYLDVVAIAGTPGEPRLEGIGEAIEHAVKMAEFDQATLLDRRLERGELAVEDVDALAAAVAAFHAGIPAALPTDAYGSPAAVWAPVEANLSHLRSRGEDAGGAVLSSLEDWSRAEYRRLCDVFAARKAAGFVRECHGDLHLGNMALLGGEPVVFDCIEFSPALRWIDVVSDLAFLVMDLSERGRPDYGWRLLNDWLEITGDHAGLELLRFYQVYRALVRAKVTCIRAADSTLESAERQAALAGAARYMDYANALTIPRSGAILVTHGFSGSGKTTLARAAAQALGAIHLRSDAERKRLRRLEPLARSGSAVAEGLYGEAATAATYERLAELAAVAAGAGYPVLIDATCLCRWQRRRFHDLAGELGLPFLLLDCRAPADVLRQRVASRDALGRDASEATVDVLARQIGVAEPLSPDEQQGAVIVDTASDSLESALARIRQRLASPA